MKALIIAVALAGSASAQQAPGLAQKIKLSEALESLTFGGDLRLRYDASFKRGAGQNDRGRSRFRLRFGAEASFPHRLSVGLRLASGTGDQNSTNQSYDDLGRPKALWIDQAYAVWAPQLGDELSSYVSAGRMPNRLWRPYSADLIWDEDFNPEGYAQGVTWRGAGTSLFLNLLQMVADEDSSRSENQWLFSQQAGVETGLPLSTKLKLAAAYHKWSGENHSTLGAAVANEGNRRTGGGVLINRFGVGEITAQLSGPLLGVPVAAQATAARNLRARGDLGPRARDGYQAGAIVGTAKAARGWELAYFRKWAETDVTVADVADSDFGDGGTNRTGHILWAAYAPTDWSQLKVKYYVTDTADRALSPGDKAVNRVQIDGAVRF